MNAALAAAVRVQAAIDEVAALKGRPPAEIHAEARLRRRMETVMGRLLDNVERYVGDHGIPADRALAREAVGDETEIGEELLEVLTDEVGDVALSAIEAVEHKVNAARKDLADQLRPFGMDRRLFTTMGRLRNRMLRRFTDRTLDALVESADVGLPASDLRSVLAEKLEGELSQLSRHALGDARNDATEVAELDLGVQRHRWVTVGDDDVRPAHAEVDGEVVDVGEKFSNGWRRPGGVGCRCRLEPVLDAA